MLKIARWILLFSLLGTAAHAQQQTYSSYVLGLPVASSLTGSEKFWVYQGIAKSATVSQILGITNSIANSSLAPMNANTVKCNPTGSAANAQDCTGIVLSSIRAMTSTGGIGYMTGAGGAITQITSRATGVTLNTVTGAITLFSAAGSTTATTFTVTNSTVVATDTIIVNQKSGTNLYNVFVTTVAAGSFNVTFLSTGGTATDAPVFNFSVIKGSAN